MSDAAFFHRWRLKDLILIGGVCLTLFANACSSGLIKSIEDISRLRAQLTQKFHGEYISVNMYNGRNLIITFINSPLNQQDRQKRASRAAEAAQFAATNFGDINKITNIWISFIEMESRLIFFHSSRSVDAFPFNNKGTAVGARDVVISDAGDDPLAPSVKFNAGGNQTNISVMRIQLEGDMNNGIALAPDFTVRGDVRDSTRKPPPPVLVEFDFASYSPGKTFTADSTLEVSCDGQIVFEGQARLLSPEAGGDGGFAQFLTAEIPWAPFVKMGNAKNVKIRLGQKHFTLTPADVEALKRMADYVARPADKSR